ncbi:hypothetical protein [Pyruvatibacter sp.]|uniref:hypothetical protein n=1 Tax=Pyruvatibacter sp. TaxID=1981328 RepID=UPI0032F03980
MAKTSAPTGGPNYMTTTLIMLAAVGALAVAISQGWLNLDEDPIHLTVTAPQTVILPRSGEVPLTYTVKLQNNTDDPELLEARTPCHIHRWFVADGGGNFVQGEPKEDCAQVVMNADLQPETFVEDTNEILLDAARYTPGDSYQMMVSYWGYERIHVFDVE